MKKRVRVVKAHTATYQDPLRVHAGETVQVGGEDEEWRGWTWCTAADGKGGWVPNTFLKIKDKSGVFKRDYDATELTVRVGDTLTAEKEESGWCWCVNAAGTQGWVPAKNLEAA